MRNEELICTECYVTIPRTNFHKVLNNPVEQLFWGRCMIEKAAAFSFYTKGSRIRKLLHNLKYNGIREIGYEIGRIYASSLRDSGFFEDIDLIIPVPLHTSKQRRRGFNQSEYISSGISEIAGIPVDTKSLKRISVSDTQTRKSRYERWVNVEGIFEVAYPELIRRKHILLVDDVITTGSTIESCASELLKIEDVKVSVLALAVSVQ
jgi:ComF family protein